MPAPWVRIVIVNYNSGPLLAQCVAGLRAQTDPEFEVVIVDNASSDDSLAMVEPATDGRFRIIRRSDNSGFAAGCNFGSRDADTPWLAMLNPDTVPDPGWVAALRTATSRHPNVAMFGSTQLSATDPAVLDGAGDAYLFLGFPWRGGYGRPLGELPADDAEAFAPCAAAALYRSDAFRAAGGFEERFFCYVEDVDLGFRLRLLGHRCVQVRRAMIRHHGSAIAGLGSDFAVYHGTRNRLWTLVRNMPLPFLLLVFPLFVAAQLYLLLRYRNAPSSRAMRDGLRNALVGIRPALAARRMIQAQRRISAFALGRALSWNVARFRSHRIDLRKLPASAAGA